MWPRYSTYDKSSVLLMGVSMLEFLADSTRCLGRSTDKNRVRSLSGTVTPVAHPVAWMLIESTSSGMLR